MGIIIKELVLFLCVNYPQQIFLVWPFLFIERDIFCGLTMGTKYIQSHSNLTDT